MKIRSHSQLRKLNVSHITNVRHLANFAEPEKCIIELQVDDTRYYIQHNDYDPYADNLKELIYQWLDPQFDKDLDKLFKLAKGKHGNITY